MRPSPSPSDLPILRLVLQREQDDCAIAALASLTGKSYEDALRAVAQIDPKHMGRRGLWIHQVEAAAEVLGMPLRRKRKYDLEEDTGLLSISPIYTNPDHLVLLVRGTIAESDGTLWEPDIYLKYRKARPGVLLVPAK